MDKEFVERVTANNPPTVFIMDDEVLQYDALAYVQHRPLHVSTGFLSSEPHAVVLYKKSPFRHAFHRL